MIPVLYPESETDFLNNGSGLLTEATECRVREARNGTFELELAYPREGRLYNELVTGAFVKAKPNDRDPVQPFRIYKVGKPVAGVCRFYGEHISYELNAAPVPNFKATGVTPQGAITNMIEDAVIQKPYTAWSDITTRKNMDIHGVYNVRALLGGVEGSLIDTFGGELQFDKYAVKLHAARGQDDGVTIRYGKNLIDAEMEKNIDSVATAIFPYAFYTPETVDGTEAEEVFVSLPEKVIYTPNAANYPRTYCKEVDFSDRFGDGVIPTEAALRTMATEYAQQGIDLPKVSIRLSLIDLSRTKDYENLWAMERVGLCDTVHVIIDRLGITETAKVVSTDYDVLHERYNEIEVGEIRPSLTKEMNLQIRDTFQRVIKTATRSEILKQKMEKRILAVTAAITGNSGGHVVLYPAENPQEILIMDTDDTATATNVWRWNMAGLGHSSTGVNGPFTTAITAAGEIVADFITAGELDGQIIKAGTIQAESLDVRYKQSVTTYIDDGLDALYDEMESRFQVTDGAITAEVSRAQRAEAANSAQIQLNATAITSKVSQGDVSSEISQEAGQVSIRSNRLVVDSTYFQLAADGHVTASAATIKGKFQSDNYGSWGNSWCVIEDSMITGGCNSSTPDGAIDLSANYQGGIATTINANGKYGLRLQHQGNDKIVIDANITFGGNIFMDGYQIYNQSDRRLKTNIKTFEVEGDSMEALRNIRPVSYDWRDGSGHVRAGLIAQDVQKYIPDAVSTGKNGYLAISMTQLVPYIWAAVREVDKRLTAVGG